MNNLNRHIILMGISVALIFLAAVMGVDILLPALAAAPLIAIGVTFPTGMFVLALGVSAAAALVLGQAAWVFAAVPIVVITLVTVYCIRKNAGLYKTVGIVSVIFILIIILAAQLIKMNTGVDVFKSATDGVYNQMLQIINNPVFEAEPQLAEQYKTILTSMFITIEGIIPSMLIVVSMVFAYFVYALTSVMIKISGNNQIRLKKFRDIHFGRILCTGFLLVIVIYMLVSDTTMSYAMLNMILVIAFLLCINGLSFISYMFNRKGFKLYLKIPLYIAIAAALMLPMSVYLLMGLGTYEASVNLKERLQNGGKPHE